MVHYSTHYTTIKPLLDENSPHRDYIIFKRVSGGGRILLRLLKDFRGDRDCLLEVETDLPKIVKRLGVKFTQKEYVEKVSAAYRHLWVRHNGALATKCLDVANNIVGYKS